MLNLNQSQTASALTGNSGSINLTNPSGSTLTVDQASNTAFGGAADRARRRANLKRHWHVDPLGRNSRQAKTAIKSAAPLVLPAVCRGPVR